MKSIESLELPQREVKKNVAIIGINGINSRSVIFQRRCFWDKFKILVSVAFM